mgnify:FL=1
MSEFLTEEEQVERLKQWWKENGRSIIAGVVIGLGIFGSWQGWRTYETRQAEEGSVAFDTFQQQARSGDLETALRAESSLREGFDGSAYADLAALEVARELTNQGRLDEAAARLRTVQESGANTAIRELARLHLGRVLMAKGAYDEAGAVLQADPPAAFAAEMAALRGDLARLQNDDAAARAAYEQALALGSADREWLELMLQNLAGDRAG